MTYRMVTTRKGDIPLGTVCAGVNVNGESISVRRVVSKPIRGATP